jgi:hypothetical protein
MQCLHRILFLRCRSQWPRGLRYELSSLARSNTGILGSNLAQGMDVCVVLCVGRGLATG